MSHIEMLGRMAVALVVGSVIGLERGWSERDAPEGTRVAGLRTFALVGFAGGLAAIIGDAFSPAVAAAIALGLAGLLVAIRLQSMPAADVGATTEVAAVATFALGVLAGLGHAVPAAAGAVATAFLLGLKPVLHRWLRALAQREVFAALQLFLISAVVLPLLPDENMGPFGAINPYRLWWMVVLIAALSLAGYGAMRLLGARLGMLVTGLSGGLVSSTATTLALVRQAKGGIGLHRAITAAIAATSTTMVIRIAAFAAVVYPPLFLQVAVPLAAMAAVGAATAIWFWRRGRGELGTAAVVPTGSPLDLRAAIIFGALLAVVMILAEASQSTFGAFGLYLLSAVSGLVDVDAITLSVADQAQRDLAIEVAGTSVVIAAGVNTAVKAGIAVVLGPAAVGRLVAAALGAMIAAGAMAQTILRL